MCPVLISPVVRTCVGLPEEESERCLRLPCLEESGARSEGNSSALYVPPLFVSSMKEIEAKEIVSFRDVSVRVTSVDTVLIDPIIKNKDSNVSALLPNTNCVLHTGFSLHSVILIPLLYR